MQTRVRRASRYWHRQPQYTREDDIIYTGRRPGKQLETVIINSTYYWEEYNASDIYIGVTKTNLQAHPIHSQSMSPTKKCKTNNHAIDTSVNTNFTKTSCLQWEDVNWCGMDMSRDLQWPGKTHTPRPNETEKKERHVEKNSTGDIWMRIARM